MPRNIYGIGETVYDILFRNDVPLKAVPGGSAFNAIVTLGRCGLRPVMFTSVGDDHVGRLTVRFMERNGVDTRGVVVNRHCKSHLSLAFLNESNDAEYQFYKDHASVEVPGALPVFTADDVVLFGSFYAINPAIRPQMWRYLSEACKVGATLYYDINFRASHIADIPAVMGNLEENLRLASVVRGSMEDFHHLFGVDDTSPDRFALAEEVYNKYVKRFCPYLLVTDGGRSAHVLTPSLHEVFGVAPIPTVSTVGAGDNFNAGFVYALHKYGIRGTGLGQLSAGDWARLVAMGQQFAACVCQSLENSVSEGFVASLKSGSAG